jgi:phosphoribosylanthranilate isomerase
MPVTVKLCGLTCAEDARLAIAAGADYLGFVFFPFSRRCLPPEACSWIRHEAAGARVGVFRDQSISFISRIRDEAELTLVQLHGEEPPELCARLGGRGRVIKAIAVGDAVDWGLVSEQREVARLLFDSASPHGGGTGHSFNWRILSPAPPDLSFWLAGGLTPENVASAIAATGASGVDVASGVESAPGRKDAGKLHRFIAAVRGAAGGAA